MSNANTATAFQRTDAGADELTQPKLGLSLPQRKMLRCCGTSTSIGEIERLFASEEAHYSRERFDRDLEKLEQFGLIQRTGAALKIVHTKPSAATLALPPQIKPAAQRAPELRRVPTAQPQPQRIVHALIGVGVIALTGSAFWLMHGKSGAAKPVAPLVTAEQTQRSAPIFIDEPPTAAPASTEAGKPKSARETANSHAAKPAATETRTATVAARPLAAPPASNLAAAKPQSTPQAAKTASAVETPTASKPQVATAPVAGDSTPASARAAPAPAPAPLTMATSIKPLPAPAPVAQPLAAPTPVVAAAMASTPASNTLPPVATAMPRPAEVTAPAPRNEAETTTKVEKKAGLKLAYREKAEFPTEALLSDIHKGSVKAKLSIDESGNVTDVTIVGAQGGRLFSRPAIAALKKWRYEPTGQRESTTAEIEFRE